VSQPQTVATLIGRAVESLKAAAWPDKPAAESAK
jgi:hypothetical protein